MIVDQPTWQLKEVCPHCGQGNPTFCFCAGCEFVTLRCEETGEVFVAPRDLRAGFTEICPRCRQVKTVEFLPADSSRIIGAGFAGEYE